MHPPLTRHPRPCSLPPCPPRRYNDGTGRVALFRLPISGYVRGTCVFIHGCKHDPYSWFYKSPRCPQCTGLPEEVAHSKQCLARGYAVMALMSLNRDYRGRCFSSSGGEGSSEWPPRPPAAAS